MMAASTWADRLSAQRKVDYLELAHSFSAESEEVAADYQMIRLSLRQHPMHFLRDQLRAGGILSSAEAAGAKPGRRAGRARCREFRSTPP